MKFKETLRIRHVDIRRMIVTKKFRGYTFDELTGYEKNFIIQKLKEYSRQCYQRLINLKYDFNKELDIWLPNETVTEFEEDSDAWRSIRREKLSRYALLIFKIKAKIKKINRYNMIVKK